MNDYQNILLKILEIINYGGDKEAFINEFLRNVELKSLAVLVQSLPNEKQTEIRTKIYNDINNGNKVLTILNSYFTNEQMQEEIRKSSITAMEKYIHFLNQNLSFVQRANLISLFEQFHPSNAIAS